MLFTKKSKAANKKIIESQASTRKLASRIIREASWLTLLFLGVYITLALSTFSVNDPAWTHSGGNEVIQNLAGVVGAYFSDLMLSIFGLSAWWLVFLSVYSIFLIYPRIEDEGYNKKHLLIVHYLGFLLLIFSSSAFEAGYIVKINASFPTEQGGMVGHLTNQFIVQTFGYEGGLIFLLFSFAIGFSLFTGWSWIVISESLGNFIFNFIIGCHHKYFFKNI